MLWCGIIPLEPSFRGFQFPAVQNPITIISGFSSGTVLAVNKPDHITVRSKIHQRTAAESELTKACHGWINSLTYYVHCP